MRAVLEALEYVPAKKSRGAAWRVKATLEVEFNPEFDDPVRSKAAVDFMEKHVGREPKPGRGFSIKILP